MDTFQNQVHRKDAKDAKVDLFQLFAEKAKSCKTQSSDLVV